MNDFQNISATSIVALFQTSKEQRKEFVHQVIESVTNGNKKALERGINNVIEKIYSTLKSELLGELYLIIHNYAERCLLFDLKNDIIGTYVGLIRQQHRVKIKTVSFNGSYHARDEPSFYDY